MKKSIVLLFSIFLFFTLVLPAFADFQMLKVSGCLATDEHGNIIQEAKGGVTTIDCLPVIVGNVISWLLVFAGIVALIIIIISGFKFVTSGGEAKQAEGARKTLTYSIIGLIVILLSFAIVAFIARTTGVASITKFGFPECTTSADCPGYKQYCDDKTLTCKHF